MDRCRSGLALQHPQQPPRPPAVPNGWLRSPFQGYPTVRRPLSRWGIRCQEPFRSHAEESNGGHICTVILLRCRIGLGSPLRIEFPGLGLFHTRVYTHRNLPGRRLARCRDQLPHQRHGGQIAGQDVKHKHGEPPIILQDDDLESGTTINFIQCVGDEAFRPI
jgi:hypothetical protein